jgi:DNA-binding winged helix-turn-helix (wHTH) protein/tetratricopeptide (TPR) repeat protein
MMERRSLADDLPMPAARSRENTESTSNAAQSLAHRADFSLGAATVQPSRRTVVGPGASAEAEPRVMQVLMAFVDAGGAVVSRDDLIRTCWAGRIVGEDALNRVIGELRRISRETEGDFAIETIPRIGYRLTTDAVVTLSPVASANQPILSRRLLLGTGLVAASVAGTGLWWLGRSSPDPLATELIERGRVILGEAWPGSASQGVGLFKRVVALEPGRAEAWGLLAVAWRNVAEEALPDRTSMAVDECERAAQRALALDPREANALAALATLHPYFGDWGAAEDRIRKVLKIAPDNPTALIHLVTLLQSVGRARDSWDLNERGLSIEPLSPLHQYRKALKLWIFGRVPEADLTIDRALQLWPRHPAVWNARLYIFAFTNRAEAAMAMVNDIRIRPQTFGPSAEQQWRTALTALATHAASDITAATTTIIQNATRGFAVPGIMILSMLGKLDAAFTVADGFLLRKGPLVGSLWPSGEQMAVNDQLWRRTMNLFTPATNAMRSDKRFASLCDDIGLSTYWRQRGVGPDNFLFRP